MIDTDQGCHVLRRAAELGACLIEAHVEVFAVSPPVPSLSPHRAAYDMTPVLVYSRNEATPPIGKPSGTHSSPSIRYAEDSATCMSTCEAQHGSV